MFAPYLRRDADLHYNPANERCTLAAADRDLLAEARNVPAVVKTVRRSLERAYPVRIDARGRITHTQFN